MQDQAHREPRPAPDRLYLRRAGQLQVRAEGIPWRNPFKIGLHGDRAAVIKSFEEHLRADKSLMSRLGELAGHTLLCHCGPRDSCHADALIKVYTEVLEPECLSDGPTSDEDQAGAPKPRRGTGWLGSGPPLSVGRGSRRRDFRDGGGLCSPGLWIPARRRYPPAGRHYLEAVRALVDEAEVSHGRGYGLRVVCSLASAKVDADPFEGLELQLKKSFVKILQKEQGFRRDGADNHPAAGIDFELLGAIAAHMKDPDAAVAALYRTGVPLGWRERLPRTPAVFERKTHWARHVGHEGASSEWTGNYRSAAERPEVLEANFLAQEAEQMMYRTTYKAAQDRFGSRLRVASLGAIEQREGEFRIIHDGTHGVRVNAAIRVRDQEACPSAHDLVAALDHEFAQEDGGVFMLALDISKAHRRVPVRPADWGLQACSGLPLGQLPGPHAEVWINTVGTYGLGSASYWWGRLGALLQRVVLYITGPAGLKWALRYADDFIFLTGGAQVWRPQLYAVLLLRALGVPLKWSKFRGGLRTDWIGFHFDLEAREAGISDGRCRWVVDWCRRIAGLPRVRAKEFSEGLGRLGFAASLLLYTKPFLGPLYSWAAAIPRDGEADVPPMVMWILRWIAEVFESRVRVGFGREVRHLGELYRADAKAEGDNIVIGGWELRGSEGTAGCRWFSLRLTKSEIPWAYTRGDPFRSIAALELLATLVCILVFGPSESHTTGAQIALTASGDNQSNGFTLDRLSSTKYPLYLVLMELSEQLRLRNVALSVAWRPRDENEEADALTNECFGAFTLERRIHLRWSDLSFLVLPRLATAAEEHFVHLHALKTSARRGPPPAPRAGVERAKLREREPW